MTESPGDPFRSEARGLDRVALVRERLLERLRVRWFVPITVVSAPAGYGKTTLLSQAIAANAAAPVGIDRGLACGPDMATASSLGYALCRAVGASPVTGNRCNIADHASAVVEAMWRRSPQQIALLLDDVHEIPAGSDAAQLLESVVATLPANGHVVLAGRLSPPVPLARLEVEGRVVRLDQADLAFTDAEVAQFATLRGVPQSKVAACSGWPALAELIASARSHIAGDYVGQEVLADMSPTRRRDLGLLAHLERFDSEIARATLGFDIDVSELLAGVPLVTVVGDTEWRLHSLWQSLLLGDVTPAEVADARRRAAITQRRRGRLAEAIRLLIDAEAGDELADTIVEALGVAHPPVARDVLADWLARLPVEVRDRPAGRLLAAVVATDGDLDTARQQFEDCRTAFRSLDQTAGEIACLVQLGQMAWWAEDVEGLATVAAHVFELEAAGSKDVAPFACLARALLHDIDNDSRQMLAELDRILPGSLSDAWWGIVSWARAIAHLELGHTADALAAADQALAHAELLHAPLAQTTRLQALWYQGNTTEALETLPGALQRIKESGYRNHTALIASQCSTVHALQGQRDRAAGYLAQARAAATLVADAPLVDTNLSVAAAAVAIAEEDEATAAAVLADHAARCPVGEGLAAAPQQRHLALFYVLVPATRPVWERAELGPAWAYGRDLARAVTAIRERGDLPAEEVPPLDATAAQAHLPLPWVAELGVAAIAAGRQDGWHLLNRTWPHTRHRVTDLSRRSKGRLRKAARNVLAHLAVEPTDRLELHLLGAVELHENGNLVEAPDWRRERVRSMLAYLALHGTVSRGQLANDLWPKLDPTAQGRNLRVTLSYLLRVLEPERGPRDASFFIRQLANNVTLHPSEWLTVDVWDFDTHCEEASRADRQGTPAVALDHALRATELWRGEPELAFEPWAVSLLEHRRLRFATAAIRAGELLLAQGDTDRAHTLAERVLTVDPWFEAAHRLVVATHRARQDNLSAQRALRRYRDAIDELGIKPDDATLMVERLHDSLPPEPNK